MGCLHRQMHFFIAILILIDTFCVHPFIKGTAVIKYTVKDNSHPFFMHFFYEMNENSLLASRLRLSVTREIYLLAFMLLFPSLEVYFPRPQQFFHNEGQYNRNLEYHIYDWMVTQRLDLNK